jgi:hypothetical protein
MGDGEWLDQGIRYLVLGNQVLGIRQLGNRLLSSRGGIKGGDVAISKGKYILLTFKGQGEL